jgi:nucleoside diphosphate kinase
VKKDSEKVLTVHDANEKIITDDLETLRGNLEQVESEKEFGDALEALIWYSYLNNQQVREFLTTYKPMCWSWYDVARRTAYHINSILNTEELKGMLAASSGCEKCKKKALAKIENREPMTKNFYYDHAKCLLNWKRKMRARSEKKDLKWPRFDHTICVFKPRSSETERAAILEFLSKRKIKIVKRLKKHMTNEDVGSIYSTAYGTDFLNRQLAYYTAAESEIVLLNGHDIVNLQNELKKEARIILNANDKINNIIHFPDSFGEAIYQLQYFFGEQELIRLAKCG